MVDNMVQMFEIKANKIPYFDSSKLESQRNTQYQNYQDVLYLKNELDQDRLSAIKEFLTYFIKKRGEITKKIEQLSLQEKYGEYHPQQQNDQLDTINHLLSYSRQNSQKTSQRKMSFELT